MLLIILLAVYLLSTAKMYIWCRNSYSKDGQWYNLQPDAGAVFFTFFPFVNTIAALMNLGESGKREDENKPGILTKLFNIKK